MDNQRSDEEYKKAQKIIKILIDNGVISKACGMGEYMKTWDLAFAILDLDK